MRSRPIGSDARQEVEQALRRAYASEAGVPSEGEANPIFHFYCI
ncbi:hypothetical protein [Leptospira wolffii]|nr:hypothetical protein [Leptospira wolffii]